MEHAEPNADDTAARLDQEDATEAPEVPTRQRLADVEPSIALGPLDGRYRPAVAPLVDHLSEAALNRERVHVEVEWLIHLTSHHVVPGAPMLSGEEREHLRRIVLNQALQKLLGNCNHAVAVAIQVGGG